MYNYRPIGVYGAKTLADEEREKRLEKERPDEEDLQQQIKKTGKNLLIVLESDGKDQFDDTHNNIWLVRHIPSFANYDSFAELAKKYKFKNIAIVHHGNTYSDHTVRDAIKVILHYQDFQILGEAFKKMETKDITELDEKYFEDFRKECDKLQSGTYELRHVKSYMSLRLLLNTIQDNFSFFSIACNEADDNEYLYEMAKMTNKKIKIFANSNFTQIEISRHFPVNNPFVINFGSILNCFLTTGSSWVNPNGWSYIDTSSNKITVTKKDLWLYSIGAKVYELVDRTATLTPEQNKKVSEYQIYYSKKFKVGYSRAKGSVVYDQLIKQIIKDNPGIPLIPK